MDAQTENQANENETVAAAATEAPKKEEKKQRIITVADGTEVNFGTRKNQVPKLDVENGTITFYIITGQVIVLDLFNNPFWSFLKNVPEIGLKSAAAGIIAKIKNYTSTSLVTDIKEEEGKEDETIYPLANDTQYAVDRIAEGKFDTRGGDDEEKELVLTFQEKAFVRYILEFGKNIIDKETKEPKKFGKLEWTLDNLTEQEVIADVKEVWNVEFNRSIRGKFRKIPAFNAFVAQLEAEAGIVKEDINSIEL